MQKKQFIPFSEVKNKQAIVVDSTHANGFMLSHWKGAPTPAAVQDDTSAAIVLHALRQNLPELSLPYVSANHFDIDGFVGVWALLNPERVLQHTPELPKKIPKLLHTLRSLLLLCLIGCKGFIK